MYTRKKLAGLKEYIEGRAEELSITYKDMLLICPDTIRDCCEQELTLESWMLWRIVRELELV